MLGAPSVESCCTLSISPTYRVFVHGRYRKSRLFVFVVGPGFVSIPPAFMRSNASHPAGPHGRFAQKNSKSGSHCWGREVSTQFAQQFAKTAETAPPLVGCIVWSLILSFIHNIILYQPIPHNLPYTIDLWIFLKLLMLYNILTNQHITVVIYLMLSQ